MTLSEYTLSRANSLRQLNFPVLELPIPLKILWFEAVTADDIERRIYTDTHSHSFFEMHFVFSGTVRYKFCNRTESLCAQHALLIPPGFPHKYLDCDENLIKISIAFRFLQSDSGGISLPEISATAFEFSEPITETANFILRQIDACSFFTPSLISGRITEILDTAFRNLQIEFTGQAKQDSDSRLSVALNFIECNKHRPITCEDVAKECCLSVKQLSRIFKHEFGNTLFDAILSSRIQFARKLLLQSDSSIKEISFQMGFDSESGFVAFFKRHCGLPPGTFRKQNLSLNEKMSVK